MTQVSCVLEVRLLPAALAARAQFTCAVAKALANHVRREGPLPKANAEKDALIALILQSAFDSAGNSSSFRTMDGTQAQTLLANKRARYRRVFLPLITAAKEKAAAAHEPLIFTAAGCVSHCACRARLRR
ncbi:MAG: hypothetical protein ACK4ZJ_03910 [Allorhizobium sp.]